MAALLRTAAGVVNDVQAETDRLVVALAVLHCHNRQTERPINERLAELQREDNVELSLVDLEAPK